MLPSHTRLNIVADLVFFFFFSKNLHQTGAGDRPVNLQTLSLLLFKERRKMDILISINGADYP